MARQFRSIGTGAALVLGLVLVSCDKSPTSPTRAPGPNPPPVTTSPVVRLELTTPPSIAPGESAQLTATAVRGDGTRTDVSDQAQWTSSNTSVIQVTSRGVATAGQRGEATLTARFSARSMSARILAVPSGTFKLSGQVTESSFPLEGVSLTVLSGVGEGLTAVTNSGGNFALYGVAGNVRLQAKKDGYSNEIREIQVNGSVTHSFEMAAEGPRTNIAGTYSLTIATVGCPQPLPEAARQRTYTARVAQQNSSLKVTLSDADFVVTNGRGDNFSGFIDARDNVSFRLGDADYYYYYYGGQFDLVERFNSTSVLLVNGLVTGKATSSAISGGLSGAVMLTTRVTAPFFPFNSYCYSPSHGFVMQKR